MVTFHTPLSPTQRKVTPDTQNSYKKRKWEGVDAEGVHQKHLKTESNKSILNIQLQLEPQLPLDWQRCLDIKSGEIHFYNTRTQKRTLKDPRIFPEPPSSPPGHMSLDLELNLPCGSIGAKKYPNANFKKLNSSCSTKNFDDPFMGCGENTKDSDRIARCPTWLVCEGEQREMVAAVCKKCHMLVMMFKTSPTCPNCKFMHPPDQSHSSLFNRSLSLLC